MPIQVYVGGEGKPTMYAKNSREVKDLHTGLIHSLRKDCVQDIKEATEGWLLRDGTVNQEFFNEGPRAPAEEWPDDCKAVYLLCKWGYKGTVAFSEQHTKIIADFFRGYPYASDNAYQDRWDKIGDWFKNGADSNTKVHLRLE